MKTSRCQQKAALTIAGSDSGGGAGIQADLKTFAALGVHGTSALTCITAQSPRGVTAIQGCRAAMVEEQIRVVFDAFRPRAAKTGMLFNAGIIRAVAEGWASRRQCPLVVDPVMIATSGDSLLQPAAHRVLRRQLLPLATLITPNLDEAVVLLGEAIRSPEDMRAAARRLYEDYGCAVLLKGGHLRGVKEAMDIFYDGDQELLLSSPFIRGVSTHGSGCTYSAAVTAHLARGLELREAVVKAKDFITGAIAHAVRVERQDVLNHPWQ